MLDAIEAAGSRWGIVTNKPHYLAVGVVASMGWTERSAILIGGDTLPGRSPIRDQLLHRLRSAWRVAVATASTSATTSATSSRRATPACKSVAALWGYRGADEDPHDWKPDAFAELPLDMIGPGTLSR